MKIISSAFDCMIGC